jgi:hypothetical protein
LPLKGFTGSLLAFPGTLKCQQSGVVCAFSWPCAPTPGAGSSAARPAVSAIAPARPQLALARNLPVKPAATPCPRLRALAALPRVQSAACVAAAAPSSCRVRAQFLGKLRLATLPPHQNLRPPSSRPRPPATSQPGPIPDERTPWGIFFLAFTRTPSFRGQLLPPCWDGCGLLPCRLLGWAACSPSRPGRFVCRFRLQFDGWSGGGILYTAFCSLYVRVAYRSTPVCGIWAGPISGGRSPGRTTT